MHGKELVRFGWKSSFSIPARREHHALGQLRVFATPLQRTLPDVSVSRWQPWDFWNRVDRKEKDRHVLDEFQTYGRLPADCSSRSCERRESMTSPRVDVRNVSLKELVHFQPAARVPANPAASN